MILSRRSILRGLIAAPIVVRAGLLMPVRALADTPLSPVIQLLYDPNTQIYKSIALGFSITRQSIFDDLYRDAPDRLIGWIDV